MTAEIALLPDELAEAIRARRPIKTEWTDCYRTRGGTYVIASNGRQSDSGKPRDLLAILPSDVGQGAVLKLWMAVNPDFVAAVEHLVAAS